MHRSRSEKLKTRVMLAFPSTCVLTQDECFELRDELVALCYKGVMDILGYVLVDLLDTPMHCNPDWEGVDAVVRFLCSANPPPLEDTPRLFECKKELEAFSEKNTVEMHNFFKTFTWAQCDVIVKWLDIMQSWQIIDIAEDEMTAAIEYWKKRSNCYEPN